MRNFSPSAMTASLRLFATRATISERDDFWIAPFSATRHGGSASGGQAGVNSSTNNPATKKAARQRGEIYTPQVGNFRAPLTEGKSDRPPIS